MKIEVDTAREVMTINGINFAFSLFDALAFAPVGAELRIIGREHGVVTMERINQTPKPDPVCHECGLTNELCCCMPF